MVSGRACDTVPVPYPALQPGSPSETVLQSFSWAVAGLWVWNSSRRGQETDPTPWVAACGPPAFLILRLQALLGLPAGRYPWGTSPASGTGTSGRAGKGECGQSQSTTGKPKRPSAPPLPPHHPWVTRYRCIWQKTHGEVTLKCRFVTLPESRGEKVFYTEGHLPFPEGESRSAGSGGRQQSYRNSVLLQRKFKNVDFQHHSALNIAAPQLCT